MQILTLSCIVENEYGYTYIYSVRGAALIFQFEFFEISRRIS